MTIEIVDYEDIKFFIYKGNKYITISDLEKHKGLSGGMIRQWKKRDKLKEGIDYISIKSPNLTLISTKSHLINAELVKMGLETIYDY